MIVIIGGGVVGLSLAFRLAFHGKDVTVLEKHSVATGKGNAASWAAAGYLEPTLNDEITANEEWKSLGMWPGFVEKIEELSGQDVDYQTCGQLKIAFRENEQAIIEDLAKREDTEWKANLLSGDELRELEPALSKEIVCATHLPQVSWVDGRKLCRALTIAIKNLGGNIVENSPVNRLLIENGRIVGVKTDTKTINADIVVVAAGYRTGEIGDLPQDMPESYGQKGIILTLDSSSHTLPLKHLIKRPDGIICPRNDGRILVGVTRQDDNLSLEAEPDQVEQLLNSAIRAMPMLEKLPLIETVVGFRPFVREGNNSAVGKSTTVKNLYYSLGHGSDGYLRAPFFSDQLADQIIANI